MMNSPDTEALRARLVARRRDVLAHHLTQLGLVAEELTPEIESMENSTEQRDAQILSTLADADVRALRQISAALDRIDAGSYGLCVVCRTAIDQARLAAVPEATTCVECARAREL